MMCLLEAICKGSRLPGRINGLRIRNAENLILNIDLFSKIPIVDSGFSAETVKKERTSEKIMPFNQTRKYQIKQNTAIHKLQRPKLHLRRRPRTNKISIKLEESSEL